MKIVFIFTYVDLFDDARRSVVYAEADDDGATLGVPRAIQAGFHLHGPFAEEKVFLESQLRWFRLLDV